MEKNKKITHKPETAGNLMDNKIPTIKEESTVEDVESLLIKKSKEFNSINYIYIVNKSKKLKGVVSVKKIFQSPKNTLIKKILNEKIVSVRPHTDQEKVALLAIKNNLKAIPVIDKKGIFIGVVTSDTIMKILQDEHLEDILRFAGVNKINNPTISINEASVFFHLKKRLPWLVIGLGGGLMAAFVVNFFELALKEQLALAAFIPAIVYMADATGTQTQTLFIRSIAIDNKINFKNYIWREVRINLFVAFFLALLMFFISFLWLASFDVSLILGLSIFATVICSIVIAITLPLIFNKMKFDPAIASGPFSTVATDVLSLLIYFTIALLVI